jgi:hypothetical protein
VLPDEPRGPAIGLGERRILVDVILEVAASTVPVSDALGVLIARHDAPGAAALATRLGAHPVETLGRWLGDDRNEPLRLALADALGRAENAAALRARLPKALRCWIPRLSAGRRGGLQLVVGGPERFLPER